MSIKDVFDTDKNRIERRNNWLRMIAAISGAKRAFYDTVTPEDEAIAEEAKKPLIENSKSNAKLNGG